ncbi:MAG: beta-N-acetylhexosaminidase [Bacteriovoracaceae bacterium]|nr:beta-N-acetylhexosaminidase [Bacteriovoracaceae bacterium]
MSNVGQLIITGIKGIALGPQERAFLEEEDVGGVILFSHNFETPAQLAELVNNIQQTRKEYPLFISVDHEGGRVIRFKKYFSQFPAMEDLAKLDSPKICFHVHKIMATELSVCGINVSYSPCCDILTNKNNKVIGNRSFGDEPEEVSKFISAAIRGLQTNNVLACSKHFPGHGSTTKDSHYELPIVKTSLDDLKSKEFIPFSRAVRSRVEFMMVAHLLVDAIDPQLPCSLSPKLYQLLRSDLKFKKIIITDDMQMKAIADRYSAEEAAVLALNAGADVLLYRDSEVAKQAIAGIKDAMKTKVIKNDAFNEKIERILDCKRRNLSEYQPVYIPKISDKINARSSQVFLEELAERIQVI